MIEKIHIQNFKSIYDLEIEVGQVNLLIGENGSGKSNLLEAFVFVSASESNKLDNEFLVSRGLRITEPELMRSAFEEKNCSKDIEVLIEYFDSTVNYIFQNNNEKYSKWNSVVNNEIAKVNLKKSNNIEEDIDKLDEYIEDTMNLSDTILDLHQEIIELSEELEERKKEIQPKIELYKKDTNKKEKNKLAQSLVVDIEKIKELTKSLEILENDLQREEEKFDKKTSNLYQFIIYSPENTSLRVFQKEGQIQPLGINGEGLLKLLQVINNYDDKNYINTIIESLQLFNWFENIKIPEKSLENIVNIKDKYLYREFTQQSANEGFLFILFYITLIVAKETPKAFAIDNIDASLNPKLCTKLMTIITNLAHKYDKQIFLTTHNPAILDGIDLKDEEQKLFVVSRNKKGHTRMKEITVEDKPKSSTNEPLKLSEAFLRGYLGGLPKGF